MNQSKIPTIIITVGFLVLIGIFIAKSALFVIDERELAVILQFGKPVRTIEEPGLYFKTPLIQEVRRFPKTLQFWRSAEDISDLPTVDGKKIEVAAWALWKIDDPLKFVQALRTVENGQLTVKDRVRAAIRDEITSNNLSEVVRSTNRQLTYSFRFELPSAAEAEDAESPAQPIAQPGAADEVEFGREKILERIKESVRKRLEGQEEGEIDRGITLVDVGISNIGFVPAVREAAFDRLIAFMDSIASGYLNEGVQRKQEILNQTAAEVEEILGEGEEKSNVLRGQADAEIIGKYAKAITETGDFYNLIKQLEVYEKSLSRDTKLILTTDSELFRLLKDSKSTDQVQPIAPMGDE